MIDIPYQEKQLIGFLIKFLRNLNQGIMTKWVLKIFCVKNKNLNLYEFIIIFLGFILSEEDKTNKTSIEYWFKILDIDNNGIITYNIINNFNLIKPT